MQVHAYGCVLSAYMWVRDWKCSPYLCMLFGHMVPPYSILSHWWGSQDCFRQCNGRAWPTDVSCTILCAAFLG